MPDPAMSDRADPSDPDPVPDVPWASDGPAGPPGARVRAAVRFPLRLRLLIVVLAIDVLVVGSAVVLLGRGERQRAEARAHDLLDDSIYLLKGTINATENVNVPRILQWPSWPRFEDAVVLDRHLGRSESGRIVPEGVALHPLGGSHRRATVDQQAIYRAIADAVESGRPIEDVEGGRVAPIEFGNFVWGGFWYRVPEPEGLVALFLRYLLWPFVFATALLVGGTFFAMRRFVLTPIEDLARAARRVAGGDLTVRLPEPRRSDEMAALIAGFNAMTAEVEGFRVRLEHEVREARDEARRAESAAMTQRRLAATGELAAGIAHEINNPLGGLLNAVDVLQREDLQPERRRSYLELLRSGLERIRATVGQLLRFTPRAEAEVRPVALVEPALDAIGLVRHRASQLGVVLAFNGADATREDPAGERRRAELLPAVRGAATELGQAVLNLLANALDALEERGGPGRIDVRLEREPAALVLSVADDGPGVEPAVLERAADLFFTTKEVGRGSGLGLSLVYNAVAASDGRVELDSAPGRGFRARLVFPLEPGGEVAS